MIIWAIIIVIFSILLWDYLARDQRKLKLAKQFNGPLSIPLLGNFYLYLDKKPEDTPAFTQKLFDTYGDTMRIWAGQRLVILSKNPRDFEILLSSQRHLTKSNMYDFMVDWLGTGLLIATGNKWFTRRKIITPTFHFKILQQFVEVFHQQNRIFIEKLKGRCDGKYFDIYDVVTLMSLDIICETAMGYKLNAQINEENEYVKAVKEISYLLFTRMMNFWLRNPIIFALTGAKRRNDRCLKVLHKFTRDVVKNRREMLLKEDVSKEVEVVDDNDVGIKKKMALLDVLLKASVDGKPLTDNEIAEEVDTFMFEGHDTVTSAISFCFYLLSENPEAQQNVLEEVTRIVGDDLSVDPTYNQLAEMKYLERCIKETLRIYPSVPIYGRNLDEDLNLDGKIVPAGCNVNLMIYNLNMDPKYFKDPEKFDPERFNENNERTENPFVYVPFSAGPRNCVGQKFAMLEMKSTISSVVRNFELIPSNIKPKLLMQLTTKSSNGINVALKKRRYD